MALSFTLVYRFSDALALSADVDSTADSTHSLTSLKNTAKSLLRRLSPGAQGGAAATNYFAGGNSLLQIDLPSEATFVVLLVRGVLFLTVNVAAGCAGSPGSAGAVSTAAAFLEELATEFDGQYGEQVPAASRPFPFLKFENFISKTKKIYVGRGGGGGGGGGGGPGAGAGGAGGAPMRRSGAATPSRVSFYKIMGLVEPAGSAASGGSGGSGFAANLTSGKGFDLKSDTTVFVLAAIGGVAVIVFFIILFTMIL